MITKEGGSYTVITLKNNSNTILDLLGKKIYPGQQLTVRNINPYKRLITTGLLKIINNSSAKSITTNSSNVTKVNNDNYYKQNKVLSREQIHNINNNHKIQSKINTKFPAKQEIIFNDIYVNNPETVYSNPNEHSISLIDENEKTKLLINNSNNAINLKEEILNQEQIINGNNNDNSSHNDSNNNNNNNNNEISNNLNVQDINKEDINYNVSNNVSNNATENNIKITNQNEASINDLVAALAKLIINQQSNKQETAKITVEQDFNNQLNILKDYITNTIQDQFNQLNMKSDINNIQQQLIQQQKQTQDVNDSLNQIKSNLINKDKISYNEYKNINTEEILNSMFNFYMNKQVSNYDLNNIKYFFIHLSELKNIPDNLKQELNNATSYEELITTLINTIYPFYIVHLGNK